MLFYEELIKKIDGDIEPKGKNLFLLEINKTLIWLGTGIPFFIIGIIQTYASIVKDKFLITDFLFGIALLFIGFRHIRMYFSYKILLDFNEDSLISGGVNISFDNIKSCTLKEEYIGKKKKLKTIVAIITKDKKQIIIPLMMNKKVKFLNLLKSKLGHRFVIKNK